MDERKKKENEVASMQDSKLMSEELLSQLHDIRFQLKCLNDSLSRLGVDTTITNNAGAAGYPASIKNDLKRVTTNEGEK